MDPGRTVAELFPPDVGVGPPPLPGHVGPRDFTKERVVDIRPIVIHTSWIAINQKVRPLALSIVPVKGYQDLTSGRVIDVLGPGARSRSPLPTRTSSPSLNDSGPASSCTTSS